MGAQLRQAEISTERRTDAHQLIVAVIVRVIWSFDLAPVGDEGRTLWRCHRAPLRRRPNRHTPDGLDQHPKPCCASAISTSMSARVQATRFSIMITRDPRTAGASAAGFRADRGFGSWRRR